MQKFSCAAIARITAGPNSRPAIFPKTNPAQVFSIGIGQKNFGVMVKLLNAAIKLSRDFCQGGEVGAVLNINENVNVFWIGFFGT
ncbi:hypothetical protein JW935_27305 [candidate division KSB1 bacterium]|nr:hypothetical protein [candidate division KSB1 bacterium]